MKIVHKNERGSLGIAMAVMLLTTLSGVTLAALALRDATATRTDLDFLQASHLLRSESDRGFCYTSILGGVDGNTIYPTKSVEITTSHSKSTYILKSKVAKEVTDANEYVVTKGYIVKSLVQVKRGKKATYYQPRDLEQVAKYGERTIRQSSFAGYQYFTDSEKSENGDIVKFMGGDELWGKVHSNDDIYIQNLNGWPLFHDKVTTPKEIKPWQGSSIPWDQVFLGGYAMGEGVGALEFNPTATSLRAGPQYTGTNDNDIAYLVMNGHGGTLRIGNKMHLGATKMDLWDGLPPSPPGPTGYPYYWLAVNDTVWSAPISLAFSSSLFFPRGELWVRGDLSGAFTVGAADTIYLAGDICYANTQPGLVPDAEGHSNSTDYFGCVSEQKIIIKYGFKDPEDSTRVKPNCSGTGVSWDRSPDGIYLYGAFCALGPGDDTHTAGVFTFEYMHPHPSTTGAVVNGVYEKWIDLHLRQFPPISSNPWPATLDYPWYNPLWPENRANAYTERGAIYIWGSIAQRNRGFVHRSLNDSANHVNGVWDLDNFLYGGASTGTNAAGATGSGVGYVKKYRFDNRFSSTPPPRFPEVHVKGGMTPLESNTFVCSRPPSNF